MNLEMAVKISDVIINRLASIIDTKVCNIVFDCEYGFIVVFEFSMEVRLPIELRSADGSVTPTKEKGSQTKQFPYIIREVDGALKNHAAGRSVSEIDPEVVLFWITSMIQREITTTLKNVKFTR